VDFLPDSNNIYIISQKFADPLNSLGKEGNGKKSRDHSEFVIVEYFDAYTGKRLRQFFKSSNQVKYIKHTHTRQNDLYLICKKNIQKPGQKIG